MVLYKPVNGNFRTYLSRSLNNTLNFEQCSLYHEYRDEEDPTSTSVLGLYEIENVVIDMVVPLLKVVSEVKHYDEKAEQRYRQRPMTLSNDIYGMTDFWYVLLAVNDFQSPYEFKNFTRLLIPTQAQIEKILDQAKFNGLTMGVGKVTT